MEETSLPSPKWQGLHLFLDHQSDRQRSWLLKRIICCFHKIMLVSDCSMSFRNCPSLSVSEKREKKLTYRENMLGTNKCKQFVLICLLSTCYHGHRLLFNLIRKKKSFNNQYWYHRLTTSCWLYPWNIASILKVLNNIVPYNSKIMD